MENKDYFALPPPLFPILISIYFYLFYLQLLPLEKLRFKSLALGAKNPVVGIVVFSAAWKAAYFNGNTVNFEDRFPCQLPFLFNGVEGKCEGFDLYPRQISHPQTHLPDSRGAMYPCLFFDDIKDLKGNGKFVQ